MADNQLIINCETGEVTIEDDTFLATKPAPPTIPITQIAPASGAGTSATATFSQPDPSLSADIRLIADVTIGTSPQPDENGHYPLFTVTFGTPWPEAPKGVMVDRVDDGTGSAVVLGFLFCQTPSITGYTILSQFAPVTGKTYRISAALG